MTRFDRSGHYRTNANGTTFWVRSHVVHRDHWDLAALRNLAPGSAAYRAADFLRRSNVGAGRSGCFVNPNARCPVCNRPVYFYANAHGSRVFFDNLGPPWPKHRCTDNPRRPVSSDGLVYGRIEPRGRGVIADLIEAANQTGLLNRKRLGVLAPDEWAVCVVEHVARAADVTNASARVLDALDTVRVPFSFRSPHALLEVGDLVSMRGRQFSFFSPQLMQAVWFWNGEEIRSGITGPAPAAVSAPVTREGERPLDMGLFSLKDWDGRDLRHFRSRKSSFASYIRRYRHVVQDCIGHGARTPDEFAARLGALHYRTAVGSQWTPRLAAFLVHFSRTGARPPELTDDLTKEEMDHFHSSRMSLDALLKNVEPIVRLLVKKRGWDPSAVAARLNKAQIRTAAGALWSPRLARFLMDLIYTPSRRPEQHRPSHRPARLVSPPLPTKHGGSVTSAASPLPLEHLNKVQLAEKLVSLGRVVLRKGP